MARLSKKPTTYLIDGSNFSRSFCDRGPSVRPDELEREFLGWLDEVSASGPLRTSDFRVFFDGEYRDVRRSSGPAVSVHFTDEGKADDSLLEKAYFLRMEGVRCAIVSSDGGIAARAASDGIKTISCAAFFGMCEKATETEHHG